MMNRVRFGVLGVVVLTMVFLTSCLGDNDYVDPVEQLRKETDAIDQYLDSEGLTAQIDTNGYDLRYIIHEKGEGDQIKRSEVSLVSIKGRVLNGNRDFLDNDSIYIGVNRWIVGYNVLLPYINVGGSMTMYIPSAWAYGGSTAFSGAVAPYSTLVLDVEVKETMTQFDYEQLAIDQYIEENELVAEIDSVYGLRYIITQQGDGETYPEPTGTVNVDYAGRFLVDDEEFDGNVAVDFNLTSLIQGWRILMPYVSEGGRITMFIPSKYGYGDEDYYSIPANSPLIFDVKLNTVK